MKALHTNKLSINRSLKKTLSKSFASKKGKGIDPNLTEFDILFVGGLHSANMIKYYQNLHFHGTMAGCNTKAKFYHEHLYEYMISGNMKSYKYLAMPFSSNFETGEARHLKDRIVSINPSQNEATNEKGVILKYKSLVINTGLDHRVENHPYLHKHVINDDFGKSRVFVHQTNDSYHCQRNARIFQMHKDGDFIVYLPNYPSKREAADSWYLALDSYFARGVHSEALGRSMKVRVITPNNELFKFPFANEIVLDEISQRTTIETHFGWELINIEVTHHLNRSTRYAYFRHVTTGEEMRLDFGTFLTTPESKPREIFLGNDLANNKGLVTVNPYTLQHVKYPNVFAFGDCIDIPTTKGLYATLNQGVVLRNNLWDYLHGNEFKAIYEGYTSFVVHHSIDRIWMFKHRYEYEPTAWNFYLPRFLGIFGFKLKNSLEKNYLSKIFQKKPNFGYPYLSKNRYFRPLNENNYLQKHNIPLSKILIHPYHQPELSFSHHEHNHHEHNHTPEHLTHST